MPNLFDLVDDIYLPSTLTNNLTTKTLVVYPFREFYFFYIYPAFLFLAAFQSLICTIVLAQKELRSSGPIFQYSLVNSIDSAVGSFLAAFLFLINCGSLCSTSYTLASELYKIIFVYFAVTALYFHSSLIQIVISCHLYFTLEQKFKSFTNIQPIKLVVSIYMICVLYGLFFASCFRIASVSTTPDGKLYFYAHFNGHDKIHGYVAIFMVAFTSQITLVVLVVLNALILIAVQKAMKKKMKMNPRRNSKVTSSSLVARVMPMPLSETKIESVSFYKIRRKQSKLTSVKYYAQAQRNFLIMVIKKEVKYFASPKTHHA